jgi:hypothetical protein
MATITQLGVEEMARTGFTHKAVIAYTDLNTTASTTLAIALTSYTAKTFFSQAGYRLVTAFDGTSTTALTVELGWNGATTDDPNGLIEALEIHNDGTEITGSDGTGVAFATKRTGYMALDAGNLEALFTATTANLTDLSSGEIHLYWAQCDTSKI